MPTTKAPEALLRLDTVKARTGLSRSLIYKLASEGRFPRALHVANTRVSVWPESAIAAWIEATIGEAA